MKNRAREYTDAELIAEIDEIIANPGKIREDEAERNAYFTDPANAEEVDAMLARMALVEAMYKARQEAGLTQKELADRLGTKQTYIAALERGRKNITFSTLEKYARACGKKVAITLM